MSRCSYITNLLSRGFETTTTSGWGRNTAIPTKILKNCFSQGHNPGGSYRLFYSQLKKRKRLKCSLQRNKPQKLKNKRGNDLKTGTCQHEGK